MFALIVTSSFLIQVPGLAHGDAASPVPTVALVSAASPTIAPVSPRASAAVDVPVLAKSSVSASVPASVKRSIAKRPAAKRTAAQTHASFAARVIAEARKHRGVPYQWGGNGPTTFDCSGFTKYVFRAIGKRLPRTASEQHDATKHISKSAKRVGDLIFKYHAGGHVYHVGIYAGNNSTWAATQTGEVIRVVPINTSRYYVGRVH